MVSAVWLFRRLFQMISSVLPNSEVDLVYADLYNFLETMQLDASTLEKFIAWAKVMNATEQSFSALDLEATKKEFDSEYRRLDGTSAASDPELLHALRIYLQIYSGGTDDGIVEACTSVLRHGVHRISFLATEDGFLGLMDFRSGGIQSGDLVLGFEGVEVELLVRREGEGYRILGPVVTKRLQESTEAEGRQGIQEFLII